jgi:hypothetical protein
LLKYGTAIAKSRFPAATGACVMADYTNVRERIASDLATLAETNNPKSIFEIAADYLLGDPSLNREEVENIIMEEAHKRQIPIH